MSFETENFLSVVNAIRTVFNSYNLIRQGEDIDKGKEIRQYCKQNIFKNEWRSFNLYFLWENER